MKAHLRIPTEQYAYIEVTVEHKEDSIDRVIDSYFEVKDAYTRKAKEREDNKSLSSKDWNTALDSYINGNPMAPDTYYAMSPDQQKIIQELKKCFKRLKSKQVDDYAEDALSDIG